MKRILWLALLILILINDSMTQGNPTYVCSCAAVKPCYTNSNYCRQHYLETQNLTLTKGQQQGHGSFTFTKISNESEGIYTLTDSPLFRLIPAAPGSIQKQVYVSSMYVKINPGDSHLTKLNFAFLENAFYKKDCQGSILPETITSGAGKRGCGPQFLFKEDGAGNRQVYAIDNYPNSNELTVPIAVGVHPLISSTSRSKEELEPILLILDNTNSNYRVTINQYLDSANQISDFNVEVGLCSDTIQKNRIIGTNPTYKLVPQIHNIVLCKIPRTMVDNSGITVQNKACIDCTYLVD